MHKAYIDRIEYKVICKLQQMNFGLRRLMLQNEEFDKIWNEAKEEIDKENSGH